MEIFRTLENACVNALQPLKDSKKIRTLEPYVGQLSAGTASEITLRFPAIYIICSGLKNKKVNLINESKLALSIIIGDSNLRGKTAVRGDKGSSGIYAIEEEIFQIIEDQKLLPGWTPLELTGAGELESAPEKHIWLYSMSYQTGGILQNVY